MGRRIRGEMSSTRKLVDFVTDVKFADIPEKVVSERKLCVLDTLGCIIVASQFKSCRILTEFLNSLGGNEEATIIVNGNKTNCAFAAWANGDMAHAPELDPTHRGHPGSAVIPAALAIAEERKATGKDLITSVALGYETFWRIDDTYRGDEPSIRYKSFIRTPITRAGVIAVFGPAIAAGKLLELDSDALLNALGICGAIAPIVPFEALGGGGWIKNSSIGGWPASIGVYAAKLAQKGFTGSKTLLEGKLGFLKILSSSFHAEMLSKQLGREWKSVIMGRKLHASCLHTHEPLDTVLNLIQEYAINAEDIRKVFVWLPDYICAQIGRSEPQDDVAARFSLPYLLAVAFTTRRRISPDDSFKIKDPKLLELHRKVAIIPSDAKQMIEITLVDGRTYRKSFCMYPRTHKGSINDPLTTGEVQEKFRSLASKVFDTKRVEEIIYTVDKLEKLDDITELIDLLVL
jgi:2-methylcitrate dehydratase PrpD